MEVPREVDLTISSIWVEERISCPTRDELQDYVEGKLDTDTADYVRFHIMEVGCPFCQASEEDLRVGKSGPGNEDTVRDRLFESTAAKRREQKRIT